MAARMDPAEALPALPLLHVFRALDAGSLGCCACVSRAWQRMANNMDLWESQCQVHKPCTLALMRRNMCRSNTVA